MKNPVKRQILILFIFSVLASVAAIIHGIFLDLDMTQIKRLTFEGLVLTILVLFPAILFLERVFDLNNDAKIKSLENRIKNLEKKRK